MRYSIRSLVILMIFMHGSVAVLSQTTSTQIWNEYMLNMPLGKKISMEGALSYSTVLGQPKWRAFDVQFTPEFAVNKHVDIMAAALLSSTFQSESLSTLEIREMIGTRIHFTPDSRILTRLLLRFEQRNLEDKEAGSWDHSTRGRIRAEALIPINARSMSHDKLWYIITDAETFIVFDQDVQERFANRLRFRLGTGYRINYKFRIEFIYMMQRSKNTIGTDVESVDNVFRLRLKHYLRP
ncbi:MAG TPA: DUF2490 domain-containing protein [Chitinophagaceae bacterium]|nr:DUF2490 domain-containing protein [Chitinophagaceae bacterium]